MSVDEIKKRIEDLQRYPSPYSFDPRFELTRKALELLVKGQSLSVSSLKFSLEDVEGNTATFSVAFCDENHVPIVAVVLSTLKVGDTLTVAGVAKALTFEIK